MLSTNNLFLFNCKKMYYNKKGDTMYIALILFVILLLILLIGGYYFFSYAIKRGNKEQLLNQPHNRSSYKPDKKRREIERNWYNENKKEVQIISKDKLNLFGIKIKSNNSKNWIILVHGFASTHLSVLHQAYEFYQMNFNILLIDLRAHGNSDGKYIGMGILDSEDLEEWIHFLNKTEKPENIGLYGISMGAATVMMTIGKKLTKSVTFAIEDCGYSSVLDTFKYQMKKTFNLPSFPFLNLAESWCKTLAKYDFHTKSPISELSKTKVPVLFIHGTKDTFVPFEMLEKNYSACHSKKEKLVIYDAGHGASETKEPTVYWNAIKKFTQKHMIKKSQSKKKKVL